MIIDTHTHFYDPSRPQGVPWPPSDNELLYRTVLPEHYKELALSEGVTGTVVVEASAWLEDNQWILDLAADDPFIVGLVGHIDPGRDEFGAELAHYVQNPLFRGIRCGGGYFDDIHAGSFLSDMEKLADAGLQLDVLVREEHFDGVLALADHLPQLPIVIDHIGHMPIDGGPVSAKWIDNYQRLAECPQIHLKVSAVLEQSTIQPAPTELDYYRPALDAIWQAFGEDRVIYGSNWPVCERASDFASSIRVVKAYFAEKGAEASEKYFWQNAQRIYQWTADG